MRVLVIVALLFAALPGVGDYINAQAYLILQGQYVEVAGSAIAYADDGQQLVTRIAGNLTIFEEGAYGSTYVVDYMPWIEYGGNWAGTVTYTGYCSWRYSGAVVTETSQASATTYTPWGLTSCPTPPLSHGVQLCSMQPEGDGSSACSPIVIDLNTGRYGLSSQADGVLFDINGDGLRERVAWPLRPDQIGLLFVDHNGNGRADDGRELFGTATVLRNGTTASNGFIALSELDSNADHRLTPTDAGWSHLRLWLDGNRNGHCETDEVSTPEANGVGALDLGYWWMGRRDRFGNELRWASHMTLRGVPRIYYDAFLVTRPE